MRLPQSFLTSCASAVVVFVVLAVPRPVHGLTQQLQSSPSKFSFGSVGVSQSVTQSMTLTNTGKTSVSISAIAASGSGFSASGLTLPAVVAAGKSVAVNITFAPSAAGWVTGQATFTSNASNPSLQVGLQGNGVSSDPLTASPASLSFGQITVGNKSTLSAVVSNPSSGKVILTSYQATGSGYSVSGPTLPYTLRRGQSITLNVTFAPQATGTSNGSVFLPGPGLTIPLTGTGAGNTSGQLTISPSSLAFGNVDLGNTSTLPSTISATGGSVTVSSASSSSAQFAISGISFPLTLNTGQSAQYNVVFSPSTAGSVNATVTLSSNASNSKATQSLSGTGVAPQYTVNLSWNPSTSLVTGYNVYRGTTSGVYTKINSSLDPGTSYADTTVVAGATYYYAATAVNSSGQESTYSTPIQVAIP